MKNNSETGSLYKNGIIGHLITIFFIQASSTTAYAVFYSGLSIYLTQNKYFTQELAAIITGLFLSLNYSLPLIGGFIGNKIISYKNLYIVGTLSSFVGCLFLAFSNQLYLALAFFLMGSLVNVCLNIFLTQLFSPNQKMERRIAFVWNYTGMNLGFMIGYFLTGFSTLSNNYFYLFTLMSILVLISLVLALIFIKEPELSSKINKPISIQVLHCFLVTGCLISLIYFLFEYASVIHNFIILATTLTLSLILYRAFKKSSNAEERKNLLTFISYSAMAIIFWTFYLLTPIAIMQLIEHAVQRKILGIDLAPQWIINIDSVIILMFAPLLTIVLRKNSAFFNNSKNYFIIAFLFTSCAFLFLASGIYLSFGQSHMSLLFMLGYLISITFGEIFLSPASNALIGELIQEKLRGIMTGAWGMNICIGGLLASSLANQFILPYIDNNGLTTLSRVQLNHVFFIISGFLFAMVILISIKFINRNATENKIEHAYENK